MVHPTGAQLAARKAAAPWISGRYWGCCGRMGKRPGLAS